MKITITIEVDEAVALARALGLVPLAAAGQKDFLPEPVARADDTPPWDKPSCQQHPSDWARGF